jgi:hypothetical protein
MAYSRTSSARQSRNLNSSLSPKFNQCTLSCVRLGRGIKVYFWAGIIYATLFSKCHQPALLGWGFARDNLISIPSLGPKPPSVMNPSLRVLG